MSAAFASLILRERYAFSLQSPVKIHFQWPLVVAAKTSGEDAMEAQADQFGHRLTAYQQYACNKFGTACRVALAIQRAENLRDLLDCRANIDFAYQLYQERGFQPWSTYNNGTYRKFLREVHDGGGPSN